MEKPNQILDSTGRPWQPDKTEMEIASNAVQKSFISYMTALANVSQLPHIRARQPFGNHAWVYAAAMAMAMNLSQAPYIIYRETDETTKRRREMAVKNYGSWSGPKAGLRRTAIHRHLVKRNRFAGMKLRGLEPDYEHPLAQIFTRVNPQMVGSQLWQATTIWMAIRGECYWLLLSEDGSPVVPGETPFEIWVLSPDRIKPAMEGNKFAGWFYNVEKGIASLKGNYEFFEPWEIIPFKFINPDDAIRGFAPIVPAAGNINMDMLAMAHNEAVLKNGADPGGILLSETGLEPSEEEDFRNRWEARNKGPQNRRKLNILTGGWKYVQTGMTPQEMDFGGLSDRDRDTVLAVMRTPKTVVGVTDELNYATQLGQDKNFWEKNLIPLVRYYEAVLDGTLFYTETDNVVGAFDLSGVEALRQGLKDQVEIANTMTGSNLHVPPTLAFEKVGLDIEEYEGSETCLVSPLLAPVKGILNQSLLINDVPVEEPDEEQSSKIIYNARPTLKLIRINKWKAMMGRIHAPSEVYVKRSWQGYVLEVEEKHLQLFDSVTSGKSTKSGRIKTELSVDLLMLNLAELEKALRMKIRPAYTKELELAYSYTVEEIGGVAVFELDDPRIIEFFDRVQDKFVGTAPKTIQINVRQSLLKGLANGETIPELRNRISEVYQITASNYKTLQVARTETTKFMNGARDVMFEAQGITEGDWVAAGDEHTRESHVKFDEAGPLPRGFNYMQLINKPGSLVYPGDPDGPAGEVINCRCAIIAVI